MKNFRLTMEKKRALEGYIFILPWIIGFSTFLLYPFIHSFILSFCKVTDISDFKTQWIGWTNYINAFIVDVEFLPLFLGTIRDTLFNTPLIIVFSLFIAILLNKNIKGRGFFRTIFFLPVLIGTGHIMQQLLGQGIDQRAIVRGIAIPEEVFVYMGPGVSQFVQNFLNRFTLTLWKSGVQIILFLAGLQGISISLYESARCDGATEWEMFWKITLPMMSPVILLNIIYTQIDFFVDVNNPLVDYIINIAFRKFQFGFGAALGWLYFIFVLVVVILTFKIMNKYTFYSGDK